MKMSPSRQLRIVLAGSVSSSFHTLQGLLRHHANVVGVFGLSPEVAERVSGYCRLDGLVQGSGIAYIEFRNINHPEIVSAIRNLAPDLLFIVGLSQLVKHELLSIPSLGCIGFHPSWLPEGRGRAPISWLALDRRPGAATFFLMDEGIDSGPILAQEPFYVSDQDYAADIMAKVEAAIDVALDRWLPHLLAGEWHPIPQHHDLATYNGRRTPEDGLIEWAYPAEQIHALVRMSSHPYPGAYTYLNDCKLIIWRSEIARQMSVRGVIGSILHFNRDKGWLVQTGNGHLWLTDIEFVHRTAQAQRLKLQIGMKLGITPQSEIYLLKQRIAKLEERLLSLSTEITSYRGVFSNDNSCGCNSSRR